MAALLPLLVADWTLPWSEHVLCTDASESGFGAVHSQWSLPDVKTAGRVLERARFRRRPGHSARDAFFEAAGLSRGTDGLWGPSEGQAVREDWEVDPNFPELKPDIFEQCRWATLLSGPWRFHDEPVVVLEARALVLGFQALVSKLGLTRCRALCIVDNMSTCLAFDRRRSRNRKILKCIRRLSAWSLLRGPGLRPVGAF